VGRLARVLLWVGYPLAGLALTVLFVFLGFPYDLLGKRLSSEVERATQVRLRIGELSPHLGLGGPGLEASDVYAAREGGRTIVLRSLVVRPAWSLAWLRGTPAVHVSVDSEIGNSAGTVFLGQGGGFQGELEGVQVGFLPLEDLTGGLEVDGRLDATIDLRAPSEDAGAGLEGTVEFDLTEGSVATNALPIAVPFEHLRGTLAFGGEVWVTIEKLELEGPLVQAQASGHVGLGPNAQLRPLVLTLSYTAKDPAVQAALAGLGRRLAPDGSDELAVSGTLGAPVVR